MPTERLNKLPPTVLEMIEEHSDPVLEAHTVTGGLNSAIAARVRTEAETVPYTVGRGKTRHHQQMEKARDNSPEP
jgi:hypothetical protein